MIEGNILEDCKGILDPMLAEDSDDFNRQLLSFVDATILPLAQLGCTNPNIDRITEDTDWADIINPPINPAHADDATYSAIRTYVRYNVRILFDPPVSNVLEIYQNMINEAFFRIEVAYEL